MFVYCNYFYVFSFIKRDLGFEIDCKFNRGSIELLLRKLLGVIAAELVKAIWLDYTSSSAGFLWSG